MDKAWTSRLARNGKTAFSPVVGWRAGLARDRCSCGRSCAGCSVSQRGACTPLVSQGLPSGSSPAPGTRISPGAPGSFEHGSVPVATQACVLERVFVRRQATAYLLACAHALTFWRLPVHTSRVCSVVNVNGDGGGSIKPEPHDVVLSTANALHLLASSS